MNEDYKAIEECIKQFSRVENITDIILLGEDGGVRRIEINSEKIEE